MNALRLFAVVLTLAGCRPHHVEPERAKAMVAAGARLVDVRTADEFASGHLPGAINLPLTELSYRQHELGPRDHPLVVYGDSSRSRNAVKALTQWGFTDVVELGSIDNWQP